MKLAIISAAVLMLASVPAVEARTVNHHGSVAQSSAHVVKVSDSTKKHKKAAKHKAKHKKQTS